MQTYQYNRLDDQRLEFRLLSIVQCDVSSKETEITLSTHTLEGAPPYLALSYVWGDPSSQQLVEIHRSNLSIPSNLYDCLNQLRKRQIQYIWADAICINQSDNIERARQVSLMDRIYESADHVIIWLGASSEESDLAMRYIPLLAKVLPTLEQPPHLNNLKEHGLLPQDHPVWLAIGSLYLRPWFSRVWTFQEAVLAPSLQVCCGDESVDWESFSQVGRELNRTMLYLLATARRPLAAAEDGFRAVDTVLWAKMAKRMMGDDLARRKANLDPGSPDGILYSQEVAYIPFASLLMVSQSKLCADPRDRVYGILSLTSRQFRRDIQISYTQDPRQLYLQTGKACLMQDRTLTYLQLVAGRTRSPDLPTWCFDLNQYKDGVLPFDVYMHAGYREEGTTDSEAVINVFEDKEYIEAVGFRADTVDQVIPPGCARTDPILKRVTGMYTWLQECYKLAESINCHQEQSSDPSLGHVYAITANTMGRVQDREALKLAVKDCLQDFKLRIDEVSDLQRYHPPSERIPMFTDTHKQIYRYSSGRSYFTTVKGKLGIGPPEIQPGDVVAIIYGTRPVFVLRESAVPDAFEFVGDAFVHGLMELNHTAEDDIGPTENFRIV